MRPALNPDEAGDMHKLLVGAPAPAELLRYVEDGAVIEPERWRDHLMRSDAFVQQTGIRSGREDGRFVAVGLPGAPRIGVLGNCQGPQLARRIALTTPCSVIGTEIMHYDKAHRDWFLHEFRDCDYIVQQNIHSDVFEGIRPREMEIDFPSRVLTVQAIHFSGLQPDIVALGGMNERLYSPVNGHSRIAVRAFLSGMDLEETLACYNDTVFANEGFYQSWEIAAEELRRREAACTIKVADDVLDLCRVMPAMYTENHPSAEVYENIACEIADLLELKFTPAAAGLNPTAQNRMPIWPVYDEIAAFHDLPYRTPQAFALETELISRCEMVKRCHASYRQIGREQVANAAARHRLEPF